MQLSRFLLLFRPSQGPNQARRQRLCSAILSAGLVIFPGSSGELFGQQTASESVAQATKLFQFEPETPEQLVDAIAVSEQLQRPLDARRFIRKLSELSPTQTELLALRKKFGVGQFLKFNANPELQPDARVLLNAINEASKVYAPSDARLQELLPLLEASEPTASEAIVEMLSAEGRAVPVLLAADPSTPAGKTAAGVLRKFSRQLRFGMLAALPSASEADRQRLLEMLGTTADPKLAPELYRWLFAPDAEPATRQAAEKAIRKLTGDDSVPQSAEEAASYLFTEAHHELRFSGKRFTQQIIPGTVTIPVTDLERSAASARALTLAKDATSIAPDDPTMQALLVVCQLSESQPELLAEANDSGSEIPHEIMVSALKQAIEVENPASATALLLRLRQQVNSESASGPADDRLVIPDTLMRAALAFPDARVRLAAASLARSSEATTDAPAVARILASVRAGSTKPEAVVIHAEEHLATELAVTLQDAGYAAKAVRTGAQGFTVAASQLNCELILVESNCIYWDLSVTVANLRADARTRRTPIVIYGPAHDKQAAISLALRHEGIWFLEEPVGPITLMDSMRFINVGQPVLTEAERTAMTKLASQQE